MTAATKTAADSVRQVNDRKIIAVASGKGGVGKTWLAITLAHALARGGHRTLLFDGDLGLANVDIQLGLVPQHDLQAVLAGRLTLKQALTDYREGGFDIIAGRSGAGSLAALPPERLEALGDRLVALAEGYDHVVLDLAAGLEHTVRYLTRPAASCLVVTTDEPTALTDAYAFIKLTARDFPTTAQQVVVNMAASKQAGERTYRTLLKACENFLKLRPPLAGIVRRDDKVRESIRRQVPVLVRYPSTAAAQDVEALARRLSEAS